MGTSGHRLWPWNANFARRHVPFSIGWRRIFPKIPLGLETPLSFADQVGAVSAAEVLSGAIHGAASSWQGEAKVVVTRCLLACD